MGHSSTFPIHTSLGSLKEAMSTNHSGQTNTNSRMIIMIKLILSNTRSEKVGLIKRLTGNFSIPMLLL